MIKLLKLITIQLEKNLLNGLMMEYLNYHLMTINLSSINKDVELIIDSTFINNKYGVEVIVLNTDNKKKKISKLSIISDKDKFIYSVINIKINKKPIKLIKD